MDERIASRSELRTAIVEDERDLARMYEMLLARMGIPVSFVATSGPEAVVKFKECALKPRVVLMDNRLPGMSGVDATKELLRIEPYTRIILLSADNDAKGEAMKAGAAIFLCKPASISEISGAIESASGRPPAAVSLQKDAVNKAIGSL